MVPLYFFLACRIITDGQHTQWDIILQKIFHLARFERSLVQFPGLSLQLKAKDASFKCGAFEFFAE